LGVGDRARVRFYSVYLKEAGTPLKIDFIEDIIFRKPNIKRFDGIPVYSVEDIYYQKILAFVGTRLKIDETGKEAIAGRGEARDIVDVYYLSKRIIPLHSFIKKLPPLYRRGIVYWYRTFSRNDFKLDVLDLDIYDRDFDVGTLIRHFDMEIKKIVKEVM